MICFYRLFIVLDLWMPYTSVTMSTVKTTYSGDLFVVVNACLDQKLTFCIKWSRENAAIMSYGLHRKIPVWFWIQNCLRRRALSRLDNLIHSIIFLNDWEKNKSTIFWRSSKWNEMRNVFFVRVIYSNSLQRTEGDSRSILESCLPGLNWEFSHFLTGYHSKVKRIQYVLIFGHRWRENISIHTFSKGIMLCESVYVEFFMRFVYVFTFLCLH